MSLADHYNNLYTASVAKIAAGDYEIDSMIENKTDNRFGITLVIRPDQKTKNNIQSFLTAVKQIEPDQYYYQNSDLHITVMSIISCYDGFSLGNIDVEAYTTLIRKILSPHKKFNIHFKGLTASPSCILTQGFAGDFLNSIRNDIRSGFKHSDLQQSLDKRYAIQTAHSTIMRFKAPLKSPDKLLQLIAQYRDFDFGTFEVNAIELVYNDWYQREQFVKKLFEFELI